MRVEIKQVEPFEGVPADIMARTIRDPMAIEVLRIARGRMRDTIAERLAKANRAEQMISQLRAK